MKPWEIGSEFHWSEDWISSTEQSHWFPEYYQLFATGTAALMELAKVLNPHKHNRLRIHLPSFYCMEVPLNLQTAYQILWYRDLPTVASPDFNSLNPLPGDIVLAVNLFGIKKGDIWKNWAAQHQEIIFVEDHSHDPFSPWARHSQADYAIAALHKTLPIPDGGMIWSPKKLPLPVAPKTDGVGAYKRLTAMLIKHFYLQGKSLPKQAYRQLELESLDILWDEKHISASIFTTQILKYLDIGKFRQKRAANIRHFLKQNINNYADKWIPLFQNWQEEAVPFNNIILCENQELRNQLQQHLIQENIFAAVHWPHLKNMTSSDPLAIDISNRILTIPSDQRYSPLDMELIFDKIQKFFLDILNYAPDREVSTSIR